MRGEGRPYAVLDGRLPEQLALIFSSSASNLNGWLVIDGGGNRPEFDIEVAKHVDLTIIPFRASEEDIDTVAQSLAAIPKALAWPSAWPTNAFAINSAQYLLDALGQGVSAAHHHSAHSLREFDFRSALGGARLAVNIGAQAARRAFETMSDYYDAHSPVEARDGVEAISA